MLSIRDAGNRERAAAAAVGGLSKSLRKRVTDDTRTYAVPLIRREAAARADDPVSARIAATGRLSVWKGVPGVAFGGKASVTSSGVSGRELVRGLELGSYGDRWFTFARSTPTGGTTQVTRRNTRQFMPDVSASGRFITPAAEAIADDVLDRWTGLVEDAVIESMDEGN
jgi:hypothetical protein